MTLVKGIVGIGGSGLGVSPLPSVTPVPAAGLPEGMAETYVSHLPVFGSSVGGPRGVIEMAQEICGPAEAGDNSGTLKPARYFPSIMVLATPGIAVQGLLGGAAPVNPSFHNLACV